LVIDAGKSQTPAGEFGKVVYDRGIYNAVLTAEAIANAQKISGRKVVTGEEVRRASRASISIRPASKGSASRASPHRSSSLAPTTTATARPSCSNGTARNG
jgi:hypothetical protein